MEPGFIKQLVTDLLGFELPAVSAIVSGVDPTGAHLWVVGKPFRGVEATCHDGSGFASIGIGRWHSQSQFMFAKHTRDKSFPETLLLTYSAKRRAEVAPGVGEGTDMFIISGLGNSIPVGDNVLREIEKIYNAGRRKEMNATRRASESAKQYIDKLLQGAATRDQGSLPDEGLVESN
jgi:hypothetical protein